MTGRRHTRPEPLTPAQLDCLRVIDELTEADGHAPTYDAVRHEMGWRSRSQVARHVEILTDKGWLHHEKGRRHSLEVLFRPSRIPDYDVRITPDGDAHLAVIRGRCRP